MSSKNCDHPHTKSQVARRLKVLRKDIGLSQGDFGAALGDFSKDQIANVEQGRTDPDLDLVLAASRKYCVSMDWLLQGKDDKEPNRAAELEPSYRSITNEQLLETLRDRLEMASQGRDVVYVGDANELEHTEYMALPYMEGEAAAGSGSVVEDYVKGYVVVHKRAIPPGGDVVAVTVDGDSMEPALPDGSIVAIDTSRVNPAELQGKIVAARTADNDVVIKRLSAVKRCLILTSDNDQVAPDERIIEVDPREVEKPIIGQVVWAWTPQAEPYKI